MQRIPCRAVGDDLLQGVFRLRMQLAARPARFAQDDSLLYYPTQDTAGLKPCPVKAMIGRRSRFLDCARAFALAPLEMTNFSYANQTRAENSLRGRGRRFATRGLSTSHAGRCRDLHAALKMTKFLVVNNSGEGFGIEAGAAYKGAVDFFLRHEGFRVLRLDRASVENA